MCCSVSGSPPRHRPSTSSRPPHPDFPHNFNEQSGLLWRGEIEGCIEVLTTTKTVLVRPSCFPVPSLRSFVMFGTHPHHPQVSQIFSGNFSFLTSYILNGSSQLRVCLPQPIRMPSQTKGPLVNQTPPGCAGKVVRTAHHNLPTVSMLLCHFSTGALACSPTCPLG